MTLARWVCHGVPLAALVGCPQATGSFDGAATCREGPCTEAGPPAEAERDAEADAADTQQPPMHVPSSDASSVRGSDSAVDSRWAADEHGLSCPLRTPCSDETEEALPLLFSASSLGEDVRFLETSEGFVLAERGDADSRVMLVVELLPDGVQPRVVELPDAELASPVTLGTLHARYSGAATLRCDGTECVVNTGWDQEVGFSDQARVELEALGESRLEGVFSRAEAAGCTPDHRVCVYGSGLHCLVAGGGWDTLIAPLSRQRIRSVAGGNGCTPTLAVGDNGLVLRRASGGWEPVATHTDADFVSVSMRDGRYTAAAEGGVLLEGNSFGVLLCPAVAPSLVAVARLGGVYNCLMADLSTLDPAGNARGLDTYLQGLTEDGRFAISSSGSRDCGVREKFRCAPPVPGAIGHSILGCGASHNPIVLTPEAVYGTSGCIYVD